jgi:hypothetical protein
MAELVCLDPEEEGHEDVVVHGTQRTAWEELVGPALFIVFQDVQTHVVVVLQGHSVLVGNLFGYGYSHVEAPFNEAFYYVVLHCAHVS